MAYGWLSPVLSQLSDENGEIRASKAEISWIAVAIEFGCLFTPLFTSSAMDKFGRKPAVMLNIPLISLSWILTLTTRSVKVLYLKRILDGMGMGIVLTVYPVFIAEVANAEIRGLMSITLVVAWYGGVLVQFFIGMYFSYNTMAWINLLIPIMFFLTFYILPESPYFLMMKKQDEKAAYSLAWYRNSHPNQVSGELTSIAEYIEEIDKNKLESWQSVFKNRIYRKCLMIMAVVCTATIMTGVTTIPSYATEIFEGGVGLMSPEICSLFVAGIFMVVPTVVCLVVDHIGRRPLLIISSLGCFISDLSSTLLSYWQIQHDWIMFATIISYCCFVSIGLVPVMIVYQGELFPNSIKSLASAFAMIFTPIVSMITLKLYYILGNYFGVYVNYLFYTTVAGLSTVWLYKNAPETKNKTFSELYKELDKQCSRQTTSNACDEESLSRLK